jgi:hypothetical protein
MRDLQFVCTQHLKGVHLLSQTGTLNGKPNAVGTNVAGAGMNSPSLLQTWLAVVFLCTLGYAQGAIQLDNSQSNPQLSVILQRMRQAQRSAPAPSYQVTREYRLFGAKNSEPSSEVTAEVDYSPPDEKSYMIQKRAGSGRGEDVVRRILQHEVQMSAPERWAAAAIDSNNYFFEYLGDTTLDGRRCYLLGLNPKRKETELIRGRAWVDAQSFMIRHIEGRVVKNPSWMLKTVELKIDFADFGGAWLQSGMEAVADVRFVGTQTLQSQTVDAHVGDLLAKNTRERVSHRKPKRHDLPATIIVPTDTHR